ncbi:MAG: DUF4221 family protein [Bacteroidota bacterium]
MKLFARITLYSIFCGILIVLFTACLGKSRTETLNLTDFLVDENKITISPDIDPYTKTMQYFERNLYWHNENRSTISKINLEKRTVEEVLKYDYDGPRGVGSISGFYFINKDTIIFPSSGPVIYMLDLNGSDSKKIDLTELNSQLTHTISLTRYTSFLHTWNNNLILNQQFPYKVRSQITDKSLEDFFPFVTYNYNKNSYERIPLQFDRLSFNGNLNDPTFRSVYNDSLLYTITTYSNRIYIYDLDIQKLRFTDLKTNLIPEFTNKYFSNEAKSSNSLEENMDLYLSEPQNLGILVDPFSNLFYRMTWPGTGVPEGVSSMKFVATPSHFILSVYDENFELKYEFELPEYEYIPHQYFVSEQGLNLFGNHPDHPDSKEDQILIHTFDFSD